MLDQVGEDLRHVEAGRALVFEHRRELVHQRVRQPRRQPAKRLLLHQRFAEAHVDAALDLSAHERRIERAADVVRDPHARHGDPPGLGIDVHFDDGGGVRVGRRRTDAAALEVRRPTSAACTSRSCRSSRRAPRRCRPLPGTSRRARDSRCRRRGGRRTPVDPTGPRDCALTAAGEDLARALGRLDGRVAHHQRDAARVRAEIDRREIRVAGDGAHVERIDAEHLRHHPDQHIVRSLADLGGAAEHGDAAAAIELQLHAGVRQVVPVDRQARAGQIRRAREADAAAERQLAELVLPVRSLDDLADALGQSDGADAQVVRGQRVGRRDDAQTAARRDRRCRCSAILSSCTSWPNRDCGVPWPRFGPHGGLLVKTRQPRKR